QPCLAPGDREAPLRVSRLADLERARAWLVRARPASHSRLVQVTENFGEARDAPARPVSRWHGVGRLEQDGVHPGCGRAAEFMVGAVADVQAFGRLDAEPLDRELVDAWVRLPDTGGAG